jgi:hypothetical protein
VVLDGTLTTYLGEPAERVEVQRGASRRLRSLAVNRALDVRSAVNAYSLGPGADNAGLEGRGSPTVRLTATTGHRSARVARRPATGV